MVVNCETMNDALEALQGALLLEEGFLVVLGLVEKVRGEDVLKEAEDIVGDEHIERVQGEEVLVDGLFLLVENSPEERVAVDDCVESFVGEAALREVAQPFGE